MSGPQTMAAGPPRMPPRQPGGLFGIPSLLRFTRDPLEFVTSMAQAAGDVVHYRLAFRDVFLLKHPELVREASSRASTTSRRARGCAGPGASWVTGRYGIRVTAVRR